MCWQFGVEPTLLDLPLWLYPVQSALLVTQLLTILLIGTLAGLVAGFLVRKSFRCIDLHVRGPFRHLPDPQRRFEKGFFLAIGSFVSVLGILAVFVAIPAWAGGEAGERMWSDAHHVALTFKSKQAFDEDLIRANDERRLRIFGQSKDVLVVFEPERTVSHRKVFVLSRADLGSVRIW